MGRWARREVSTAGDAARSVRLKGAHADWFPNAFLRLGQVSALFPTNRGTRQSERENHEADGQRHGPSNVRPDIRPDVRVGPKFGITLPRFFSPFQDAKDSMDQRIFQ